MKMEVRCCCTPIKLLGWLDVEPGATSYKFAIIEPHDLRLGFEAPLEVKTIVLPVAEIHNPLTCGPLETYPALKSEETPIETLRLIRGFIEAPHAEHLHE